MQSAAAADGADTAEDPMLRAQTLARRLLIVDGHVDLPYRLHATRAAGGAITQDISRLTSEGDFDYARARTGGLDAPFMSIYVPAEHQTKGDAKAVADMLIDMVEDLARKWPAKFALVRSVADVEQSFQEGKIALPMGIENGAAIEEDLANVRHFHDRGVRYITLTHAKDNQICDSSYDETRTWKGLSPFGKQVVEEMNRVGIMVDVSHVSDDAFYQVMDITKVPVIASHSSARHFTPGFERNMSDAMIERLAQNQGVIMINFGSAFISAQSRAYFDQRRAALRAYAAEHGLDAHDPAVDAYADVWKKEHPPVLAHATDVANHIDHVVGLVGVDHVGFGSDFDGVGESLPIGLENASMYPNLIRILLERGYSEEDIEKMCSGNLLRVWRAVEAHAAR